MHRITILAVSLVASACDGAASQETPSDGRPVIDVTVDGQGYHPSEARAPASAPIRLVFTRTSDEGCGQQLVIPSLDIRRDLPLDERVVVDVTMPASGSLAFTCGMDMYRGSIVVQ